MSMKPLSVIPCRVNERSQIHELFTPFISHKASFSPELTLHLKSWLCPLIIFILAALLDSPSRYLTKSSTTSFRHASREEHSRREQQSDEFTRLRYTKIRNNKLFASRDLANSNTPSPLRTQTSSTRLRDTRPGHRSVLKHHLSL